MKLRPKIRFFDQNKNRYTIPVSQIDRLTGRKWFDFDYSLFNEELTDNLLLISYFEDPLSVLKKLEIRFMSDKVGYGLYAAEDISENTIIGFVSGELKKLKTTEVEFDSKNPTSLIESGTVSYDDYGNIYIIDSSKKSNHTHYVQHLPSYEMLLTLVSQEQTQMICTANLSEHSLKYGEFDLTYFCTTRNIKKGEIIGCPYQVNEDEIKMNQYCFFTRKGEIVTYDNLTKTFDSKLKY